ncbi:MAG: hypothetical protein ACLR0V_02015 [Roseburia hominis]
MDNIFAYRQPLPYVKKIDLYGHRSVPSIFWGRADQSANEEVMMRRIDQQIKVTKIVASCVDLDVEVRQRNIRSMPSVQKYFHHDGNFLHPSPSDQRPRRVGEAVSFCGIPSVRRTKCSTSD